MNFLVVLVPTGIWGSNSRMHYIYGIGTYNGRFQWCFYVFSLHTWDSPRGLIPTAVLKPWNPLLVGCKAGLRCCLGGCVETTNQDMFCFSIITLHGKVVPRNSASWITNDFPSVSMNTSPILSPPAKKKSISQFFPRQNKPFPGRSWNRSGGRGDASLFWGLIWRWLRAHLIGCGDIFYCNFSGA